MADTARNCLIVGAVCLLLGTSVGLAIAHLLRRGGETQVEVR